MESYLGGYTQRCSGRVLTNKTRRTRIVISVTDGMPRTPHFPCVPGCNAPRSDRDHTHISPPSWPLQKRHPNAFLSLSTAINARSPAHKELIAACASDRILVESDFHDIRRSAPYTWHMLRTVAAVKGWAVEDHWDDAAPEDEAQWGAVRRLEENWKAFERGRHRPHAKRRQRRDRAIEEWEDANEDSD